MSCAGGGWAGASGRPGARGGSSIIDISAISTNSNSSIFFTTFGSSEVAGLKGPVAEIAGSWSGKLRVCYGGDAWATADASRSSPDDEGVKMGSLEAAEATVFIG